MTLLLVAVLVAVWLGLAVLLLRPPRRWLSTDARLERIRQEARPVRFVARHACDAGCDCGFRPASAVPASVETPFRQGVPGVGSGAAVTHTTSSGAPPGAHAASPT